MRYKDLVYMYVCTCINLVIIFIATFPHSLPPNLGGLSTYHAELTSLVTSLYFMGIACNLKEWLCTHTLSNMQNRFRNIVVPNMYL